MEVDSELESNKAAEHSPPRLVQTAFQKKLTSNSPLLPVAMRSIEQLMNVTTEFNNILTDTTEQLLRLRNSLGGLKESLHILSYKSTISKRSRSTTPRLVIAGAPQTGKSTLINFLLHRSLLSTTAGIINRGNGVGEEENFSSISPEKIGTIQSEKSQPRILKIHNSDMHSSVTGNTTLVSSHLKTSPHPTHNNNNNNNNNNISLASQQLPPLRERSRRRLCQSNDKSRSVLSFKFVSVSPFPEWRPPRFVESNPTSPSVSPGARRAVAMQPGSFDNTIMHRIIQKHIECKLYHISPEIMKKYQKDRVYHNINKTLAVQYDTPSHLSNVSSRRNSSCSSGVSSSSPPASAVSAGTIFDISNGNHYYYNNSHSHSSSFSSCWMLMETNGSVVRSERLGLSSYQVPDSISGDAIFFNIPCDVVGTQYLINTMAELFGPFAKHLLDDSSNQNHSDNIINSKQEEQNKNNVNNNNNNNNNNNVEVQKILQLISDMTIYVLTFSDAIRVRSEGVLPFDEYQIQRPPPMVSNYSELIYLFIKEMKRIFGVSVLPWQIITFSGTLSQVTRDVLTAIYEKRLARVELTDTEESGLSISTTDAPFFPLSSSNLFLSAQPTPGKIPCLKVALYNYCDIVYGKRFSERKSNISLEQLEELVWYHAFTNMWKDSGAEKVLEVAKCFEWNSNLFLLSRYAVTIVIWTHQLQMLLPQAKKIIKSRQNSLKKDLKKNQKKRDELEFAMKYFQKRVIPRDISQNIQIQLQDRFENFTVMFWFKLLNLFGNENKKMGILTFNDFEFSNFTKSMPLTSSLLSSSSSCQEARERLQKQYQLFLDFYLKQNYNVQMSQLQRIIKEENKNSKNLSSLQNENYIMEENIHHLPIVQQNVREFKATMEKELTLQLSRFNTEVINYFIAELVITLPEFVELCNQERNNVKKNFSKLLTPFISRSKNDLIERKILRSMINDLSQINLVELQSSRYLESFVTGLRSALCEDQILLILNPLKNSQKEGKCTRYAARTSKYIKIKEDEINNQQMRPSEVSQQMDFLLLQKMREHEEIFWAPLEPIEINSQYNNWIQRLTYIGIEEKESNTNVSTSIEKTEKTSKTILLEDVKKDINDEKNNKIYDHTIISSINPVWFLFVVWKDLLSSMSFRPWILLHSVHYASLVNNIGLMFLKCHEKLEGILKDDFNEIEVFLRAVHTELHHIEDEIPAALQRLSISAMNVAQELKCAREESFSTEI